MNRDAAIEAGARVRHERRRELASPAYMLPWEELLPIVQQRTREEVAAVIDAALPHLVGEPVEYRVNNAHGMFMSSWATLAEARVDVAALTEECPKEAPFSIVALIPVEDAP